MEITEEVKPKLRLRLKVTQDWTITDIATKQPPVGWVSVFQKALTELKAIDEILQENCAVNGRFYPDKCDLFRAFELTPLHQVRVVIVGQDPYPHMSEGRPTAVGVSFGSFRGAPVPKSLITVYKELARSFPETFQPPNHADLTKWCQQGVLMLNTCLTVLPGKPDSHKKVWAGFIHYVITAILETNPKCIFVLWGNKAKELGKMLGNRGVVLEGYHPSPMSQKSFLGCNHFIEINRLLTEAGQTPIDWSLN